MFYLVPKDEWDARAETRKTARLFNKVVKHRKKHEKIKMARGKAGENVHSDQLDNSTTTILHESDASASTVAADAPGKQCITAGCRGQTRDEENKWCDPCFENMKCILDKKWPVADWPAACIVLEWKADTDCQASPEGLHPC